MAKNRNWYSVNARANEAHVYIFDEIGGFGVTAKAFIRDLQGLGGRAVTLHVNSPGGDMFEALAIYNALVAYPGHVTAIVEGVAASAASFIIMAADEVIMPANAMLMVHNASGGAYGGEKEMNNAARILINVNASMVSAYAAKSGLSSDRVAALMAAETWMTAAEAKAMGFADEVREAVKVAASFDLSRYPRAPRSVPSAGHPMDMVQLAPGLWGARGHAPARPADPNDLSDLIPPPMTSAEAFAKAAGRFAGRKG